VDQKNLAAFIYILLLSVIYYNYITQLIWTSYYFQTYRQLHLLFNFAVFLSVPLLFYFILKPRERYY